MNKSFKVVFSKARGALMVVNELTSSVQAKGTKTVIAVAVASLVAGGAMAADTAKPGALLSWNGTELVGQAAGEGLVYSTKDGVLTITATGQKTGAEGVPGYGVVTNLYHADATGGTDILAKTGVSITGSNFKNNASTNAGGAVTLWQDGGAEAQPLAHRISASTFEGNSANFGGAVALMNQIAFAKNDGTTLSEGNVYKSNTGASGGASTSRVPSLRPRVTYSRRTRPPARAAPSTSTTRARSLFKTAALRKILPSAAVLSPTRTALPSSSITPSSRRTLPPNTAAPSSTATVSSRYTTPNSPTTRPPGPAAPLRPFSTLPIR